MVELRIEEKPAFCVAGQSVYITGQDNEQFGSFWKRAHESGLVDRLKALSRTDGATGGGVFGVSCVDEDPDNRAFDFIIAAEVPHGADTVGLESREVPACLWAIFKNRGELPMSLVNAEMHAFMEWLPVSEYRHANAPELEVYPPEDKDAVEFWLPIAKKPG